MPIGRLTPAAASSTTPIAACSTSRSITERLAEAGLVPSVGSVGDSYDNALAETINGHYKAELIHRRGPWRSLEAVEYGAVHTSIVGGFAKQSDLQPVSAHQ